ncbi:MAG: hypothetical protein GY777_06525 [Candidatus Brocadiaceae bacterium]|nr:hypothetical protein [Candidatus Brocadiaceae bacterium]
MDIANPCPTITCISTNMLKRTRSGLKPESSGFQFYAKEQAILYLPLIASCNGNPDSIARFT